MISGTLNKKPCGMKNHQGLIEHVTSALFVIANCTENRFRA